MNLFVISDAFQQNQMISWWKIGFYSIFFTATAVEKFNCIGAYSDILLLQQTLMSSSTYDMSGHLGICCSGAVYHDSQGFLVRTMI